MSSSGLGSEENQIDHMFFTNEAPFSCKLHVIEGNNMAYYPIGDIEPKGTTRAKLGDGRIQDGAKLRAKILPQGGTEVVERTEVGYRKNVKREAVYEIVGTTTVPGLIFKEFRDVPLYYSQVKVKNETSFDVVIYVVASGLGILEIVRAGQSGTSPVKVAGNVSHNNKFQVMTRSNEDGQATDPTEIIYDESSTQVAYFVVGGTVKNPTITFGTEAN